MEKGDNAQQTQSTGATSTQPVPVTAAPGADTTDINATGTTNVSNLPGFLQNIQSRLNSMGDDASGFLAMRYIRVLKGSKEMQLRFRKCKYSVG
ncbi:unnamed protein product [Didymodactylos carnosus]|uniref:Uncharacterized protein n=1 Tax=Didymodactylos carnosus TaxID=1234261 RepID=A0A8S2UHM0_9BILA|nr:unnamed protein product [Didymodactylos carnosus]CAF4344208.1 unnamed protein product [Didymodactylos carnosus]